jgi:hypothetical protein
VNRRASLPFLEESSLSCRVWLPSSECSLRPAHEIADHVVLAQAVAANQMAAIVLGERPVTTGTSVLQP